MLEILQFIFSSFWVWLGTFLLIAVSGTALNWFAAGFRGKVVKW